ncbi:DUF397 domain-containing protein [Glycomyces buryatensis]|uniref:DUF397 domain-containing protein n=1 Tax=Glycomyces buryatensis TaxID=2570927 RepID=A0A4S8QCC8_9ACTN|nr:DUF397 domain-containing protein [Glycomyces buryatensis]THV40632.1 DUF397 domain-containing protein [Glycomyces buryatensis]
MLSRNWKKSTRSGSQGNCVELRLGDESVQVRDSKLGDASPILSLDPASYAMLIEDLKRR